MQRRQFVRAAAGAAGLSGVAGCVAPFGASETATGSATAPADGGTLRASTRNGDVAVAGTDREDVLVEWTKRTPGSRSDLDRARVEVRETDGVRVEVVHDGSGPLSPPVSVDLDVEVPREYPVARVETNNGEVSLREATGDPTLRSANGDVEARSVEGYPTLASTNGDLTARDVVGVAGAGTTNGEVDVDLRELRDDTELRSNNGDVRARVPADLGCTVVLRTANGEVAVSDLTLANATTGPRRVDGRLGGGGPTLTLATTNGDATLERLG